MTTKVHGKVAAGEKLGRDLDFYVISTSVDILQGEFGSASQVALDKLVEIIALNGQPVIMGAPYKDGSNYVFKFALEHTGSWGGAAKLKEAIVAHQAEGMGFDASNTTVVIANDLSGQ